MKSCTIEATNTTIATADAAKQLSIISPLPTGAPQIRNTSPAPKATKSAIRTSLLSRNHSTHSRSLCVRRVFSVISPLRFSWSLLSALIMKNR